MSTTTASVTTHDEIAGWDMIGDSQRALVADLLDDGDDIGHVYAQHPSDGRIRCADLGDGWYLMVMDAYDAGTRDMVITDDRRQAAMDWLGGWDEDWIGYDSERWMMYWGIPGATITVADEDDPGPYGVSLIDDCGLITWVQYSSDEEDHGTVYNASQAASYDTYADAEAACDAIQARVHDDVVIRRYPC